MISPKFFVESLAKQDISFFTGVPDSLLKNLCAYISDSLDSQNNIIAANEGGAVGLAAGYHLATGKIPVVYMQNSGQGNTVNPLMSLTDKEVYNIPVLLIIGWRGEPGVHDEPQHIKQGKVTLSLLEAMGIAYCVLSEDEVEVSLQIEAATAHMRATREAYALIVRKGTFAPYSPAPALAVSNLTTTEPLSPLLRGSAPLAPTLASSGAASLSMDTPSPLPRGSAPLSPTVASSGAASLSMDTPSPLPSGSVPLSPTVACEFAPGSVESESTAHTSREEHPVSNLLSGKLAPASLSCEEAPAPKLLSVEPAPAPLSREEAVDMMAASIPDRAVIVATTGMISRELFEYRTRAGQSHERDFLTVGSMGHASQIALGIALNQPSRTVYCFDGDGAAIMHLGNMAIIGSICPSNYVHVVFNNGAHDSVGGQPTVGLKINLPAIAKAVGYKKVYSVDNATDLQLLLAELAKCGKIDVGFAGAPVATDSASASASACCAHDSTSAIRANDHATDQVCSGIATTAPALPGIQADCSSCVEPATATEPIASAPELTFIEVKVRKGARAELGRPTTTPIQNKEALMEYLNK